MSWRARRARPQHRRAAWTGGRCATLTYLWAPRGSRPAAVRDNRHDSAYLFGAICQARAVGAAIVMPFVSSEAMSLHLAEIATQVGTAAHAVLVCDGAGWHHNGERLIVPDNITLLRLPPYAVEVKSRERMVGPNKTGAKGSFTIYALAESRREGPVRARCWEAAGLSCSGWQWLRGRGSGWLKRPTSR